MSNTYNNAIFVFKILIDVYMIYKKILLCHTETKILKPFMKQLNRFTILQYRALQPVLRTIMMSQRITMSHVHLV